MRRLPLSFLLVAFLLASGLVLGSCGGRDVSATVVSGTDPTDLISTASTDATAPIPTTTSGGAEPARAPVTPATAQSEGPPDTPPDSIAAITSGETPVFASIGDRDASRLLPAKTILGTPTVVSVIGEFPGWIHALLPGRPNGETGWIRANDLEVFTLDREVVVDLDQRQLTVLEDGRDVFTSRVAIGSEVSPTPTGTFFVTDAVQLTIPGGPWGPYAFGLSARSDVVTEFNGGDGIVGIHGTNQPNSIGQAASLGCVRLPNDVIVLLWELMAVGMKVTIIQTM